MLSHCEFPCVVQGIRDLLNARHKKSPTWKFKSAQSVYASNTVTHKELVEGSFKMSEIAIVKTGNLQDEIFCHLNIRYTPVNVY